MRVVFEGVEVACIMRRQQWDGPLHGRGKSALLDEGEKGYKRVFAERMSGAGVANWS
jgi:hypothetical protein